MDGRAVRNFVLTKRFTVEFCLFFIDMTYLPGQFIPYIFFAPRHKRPFSKIPRENTQEKCFSFFIFSTKFKMADESHVTLKSFSASPICSKEATYPGHMLIRCWCGSDITFARGLHKNLVTVLYFFIINVLGGAGGDASFAPQANLVISWYWWTEPTAEGSCHQLMAIFMTMDISLTHLQALITYL